MFCLFIDGMCNEFGMLRWLCMLYCIVVCECTDCMLMECAMRVKHWGWLWILCCIVDSECIACLLMECAMRVGMFGMVVEYCAAL